MRWSVNRPSKRLHSCCLNSPPPARLQYCPPNSSHDLSKPCPSTSDKQIPKLTMQTREIEPRRILLVDDDQSVRQSISLLLGIDNHTVMTAADGAEALNLLKSDQFDLVITDFDMPGINGDELTWAGLLNNFISRPSAAPASGASLGSRICFIPFSKFRLPAGSKYKRQCLNAMWHCGYFYCLTPRA